MRTLSIALFLLFASGCTKTKECDLVVSKINPALAEIKRARESDPGSASLTQAAEIYDLLAVDLGTLKLRTKRLDRAVSEYQTLFRRAARAARALVDAAEKEDTRALSQNERELERVNAQERVLLVRVNSFCQSP